MATMKEAQAVKSLNKTPGRRNRRFVFKNFSQRVQDIEIDVFRSLVPVKPEPSTGTSFFLDCLIQWRELNTAEDFITLYNEVMPLAQTLPLVILHRELILSKLLSRLHLEARLSLEPILRLVAELSRDLLEDFLPFLPSICDSLLALLKNGADRDSEIIEQIFTSWSCIMMYLQKYLTGDMIYVLKVTTRLRYYSKDFIREFMAEAISFLMRNAPIRQLIKGIRKIIGEVVKRPSQVRKSGSSAILWQVMRGTCLKFHSRAEQVLRLLLDDKIFDIGGRGDGDQFNQGSDAVIEVLIGCFKKLCTEIDLKELKLMWNCFHEEITDCSSSGRSLHLTRLLKVLISIVSFDRGKKVSDYTPMLELVELLVQTFIMHSSIGEVEDQSTEVVDCILQLMQCVLDGLNSFNDLIAISNVALVCAPAFELRNTSFLRFLEDLLEKDQSVLFAFRTNILSACKNLIETAEEEVTFMILKLCQRLQVGVGCPSVLDGLLEEVVVVIRQFAHGKICFWIKLINDIKCGDSLCSEMDEARLALLWGILCSYPYIMDGMQDASLLVDLVDVLDQLLIVESGDVSGVPRQILYSLIGAAISSYGKMAVSKGFGPEHTGKFLCLAKRYRSSSQIISSVADILDVLYGSGFGANISSSKMHPELEASKLLDAAGIFAENLCNEDKAIRISTLRILCHFEPLSGSSDPVKEWEDCVAQHSYTQFHNILQLLLSIEETPISLATSRKITLLVSKIQNAISAERIHEAYISLVLNGIIGILYNEFKDLSTSAIECLSVLLDKMSDKDKNDKLWDRFVVILDKCVRIFLKSHDQDNNTAGEAFAESNSLLKHFRKHSISESYRKSDSSILSLLLQALQKVAVKAERHSRQIVPLFFMFLGYNDDVALSNVGSFDSHICRARNWKAVLIEWLKLLGLMRDPRSFYCNKLLKEVFIIRLLDADDPEVQIKVLDVLLNWKDNFLAPYGCHLKNLVSSKSFREELTTWSLSKESNSIEEGHRKDLVPLIIRLLVPKVRNLKTLASRKHASMNSRKAVLGFVAQLDVAELPLFFKLLVKPLQATQGIDARESWFSGLAESGTDEFQATDFLKFFTVENILALPWKKRYGFLHVFQDILGVFDEYHVRPFLDFISGCTVRILRSCSSGLAYTRNGESNQIVFPPGQDILTGEDDGEVVSHMKSGFTVKVLKDIRSLCLKIMSLILHKYDHDFGLEFWDEFFAAVKQLIDGFKQESSQSEKQSSLFSCFLAMSRSHNLVSLLWREKGLVPDIFSILSVTAASDAALVCVLKFINNLLSLEIENENGGARELILPHIEVLVCNLHHLFHDDHQKKRKLVKHPGELVLSVLKLLSKFIRDSASATKYVDILLPLVNVGAKNSDMCLESLQILQEVVPILGGQATSAILSTLSPLLVSSHLDIRLSICNLLRALAQTDPSISPLALLLCQLNATSSVEMGELDYDTVVSAYDKIDVHYFANVRVDHALVILSHCIHDMSSEDLLLRHCAYRSLQSFVEFCASVCSQDQPVSDHIMQVDDSDWTKACIQRLVNKFLLKHMGNIITKGTSDRKDWIDLLREMVLKLSAVPNLRSMNTLSSQDDEVDFFKNITHLQKHRRARALMRFTTIIKAVTLPELTMKTVFVPLFSHMLSELPMGKEEHLRNACLDALASIAGKMEWKSYYGMLLRCFKDMTKKPEKQKVLVRLVCSILDEFHFLENPSREGIANNGEQVGIPGGSPTPMSAIHASPATTAEIQSCLIKAVLPKLQKLLISDSDRINVNVSLAVLKVLKLLPVDVIESQLPIIIHRIANFLKNRLESTRDEARSALAACLKELGTKYLQFIVKTLKMTLKRGYELHVLGYTVNFILSKGMCNPSCGEIDYCFDDVLGVVECDILGDVAEEKEVEKIASKMKETRKRMSFDTLKLIAQNVTFKTHALKLLSPVIAYLQKQHLTSKVKSKVENMLNHIAAGIELNPSVVQTDLFIFLHSLIDDGNAEVTYRNEGASAFKSNDYPNAETVRMTVENYHGLGPLRHHLITVFALGIFHNRVRKIKVDKKDGQLLSMLDPFVNLLTICLNSKYEEVVSAALKCISELMRLPLPSLETQADKIKTTLLDIAQSVGNATNPILQTSLRLLTELLRSTKVTLSSDQLHVLVQFPVFVDLERNPSVVALSLLKAIVRRKLVVHEIYDIAVRVAELMVTSLEDSIRKRCSGILLQFLLNYKLSQKRMQQHLDFLIINLRYEHVTGREAVLEMIRVVIQKFPQTFVDEQAQMLFFALVERLANDPDSQVRSLIATAIRLLIARTSSHSVDSILKSSLAWYLGKKQHLWSTAAQVLGLLVEVMEKRFRKHVNTLLVTVAPEEDKSRMKMIVQAAVDALVDEEPSLSDEPTIPYWKEAYYSLILFQKILVQFPELCFENHLEDIWKAVAELLIHPHPWIRSISNRIVALYFSQMSVQKKPLGTSSLTRVSKLFAVAVSQCCQLRAQFSDEEATKIVQSNLVFTVCSIHALVRKADSGGSHTFWSSLDPQEMGSILRAFHLLDVRKGRELAALFASWTNNQTDQQKNADLCNLLVCSLLETMGKIVLEMEGIQAKTVLGSLQLIASQIGQEGGEIYATQLLQPLYRICEGFAGKVIPDDIKRLAGEVSRSIQESVGSQNFVHAYGQIRSKLKTKRDQRKREEKLMAVVNPERNAKRKLRNAAKHRANKRRKIMVMKMSRWNMR
ncbi:hypothetical protein Dimus_029838 [Dionaea muscipula]